MRTLPALLVLASAVCVSACASSSPPAAAPEEPAASSSAPAAAPEPAPAPATDSPQPTIESQREPFVEACNTKAHSADYCDCAFGQFREVFKDADLSQPLEASDPRLKTLQEKTAAACAARLSEDQVKANFLESCASGDQQKSAYCNCAWSSLRKNLAVADFIIEAESPRLAEAKKTMVVACKGKLSAGVAMKDFMAGCTKDHPEAEKTCTCLWKKIKAKFSAEEIAAGVGDLDSVPGLSDCKK